MTDLIAIEMMIGVGVSFIVAGFVPNDASKRGANAVGWFPGVFSVLILLVLTGCSHKPPNPVDMHITYIEMPGYKTKVCCSMEFMTLDVLPGGWTVGEIHTCQTAKYKLEEKRTVEDFLVCGEMTTALWTAIVNDKNDPPIWKASERKTLLGTVIDPKMDLMTFRWDRQFYKYLLEDAPLMAVTFNGNGKTSNTENIPNLGANIYWSCKRNAEGMYCN